MKITNLRKVDNMGNLKAFFELETLKMVIRDCKLLANKDGELFAAMPSRQYEHNGQKKWTHIVHITDLGLLDKISLLAREAYGEPPQSDENDIPF